MKLFHLLEGLTEAKRLSAINDPEMFANYIKLASNSMEVIEKHIEDGINQIEKIIVKGITEGIFFAESPRQMAKSILLATSVFSNPNSFEEPDRKQNIKSVVNLLLSGLKNPNK